jgi:hypothetical protein
MTPLIFAVASENQDANVVKMLLSAGSDAAAKDIYGESAADWARKYGYPDVLSALKVTVVRPEVTTNLPAIPPAPELRKMIQDSASLLLRTTKEFSSAGGCAACHAQHFTSMALTAAQGKGVPVDERDASALFRSLAEGLRARQTSFVQRLDSPGIMGATLFTLSALHDGKYPADEFTDSAILFLLSRQFTDGRWPREDESRSPLDDGDFNRTALAVAALHDYAPASLKNEVGEHVARARNWMLKAQPKTTDDRAMQLLGLSKGGAEAKDIKAAANALLALQRADGGWSPNPNLQSDAYATSQALWVLSETQMLPTTDPVYRRGVQFLLKTREADGSWHVKSRAPKFQPYFESSFPHGHDQWISSAATARAVMVLSRFL